MKRFLFALIMISALFVGTSCETNPAPAYSAVGVQMDEPAASDLILEAANTLSLLVTTEASRLCISSSTASDPYHASLPILPAILAGAGWVWRFLRSSRTIIEAEIAPAIQLMSAIRSVLESPSMEALLKAIPGDWDEKFVKSLTGSLATAIRALNVIDQTNEKLSDSKLIEAFITWLNKQPSFVQEALMSKTAAIIAKNRNGRTLTQSQADLLIQSLYTAAKNR